MQIQQFFGAARAAVRSRLHPLWREAIACVERGWEMDRAGLEAHQMRMLAAQLSHYRSAGLTERFPHGCEPAGYAGMHKLPTLTREGMQELYPQLEKLFADRRTWPDMTSGTTGQRVPSLVEPRIPQINEAHKYAMQRLIGMSPATLNVCLWAANLALGLPSKPRGRLSGLFYPRVEFNGFKADGDVYRGLREAVMRNPGCAVVGYAGALAECGAWLNANGLAVPEGTVHTGWTGAEALTPQYRAAIHAGLGYEPREMYGSKEVHWVALECLHGTRHISARHIVEAVDPESHQPLPQGESGLLLITDLVTEVNPLIRYAIGDFGSVEWRDCACGRSSFVMKSIDGRTSEVIHLPNGKRLHAIAFTWCMRIEPRIMQWQLVRKAELEFEMLVRGTGMRRENLDRIGAKLGELLEGTAVTVREVDEIPKTPGGKVRAYLNEQ